MCETAIKTGSFEPIMGQILVLGSRATPKSLSRGMYYTSNKNGNIIWEILDVAFPDDKVNLQNLQSQYIDLFDKREDVSFIRGAMLDRLKEIGVGFSDVLFECESTSSRDNDIKNAVINPNLKDICSATSIVLLNGKTAAKLFKREIKKQGWNVNYLVMSSTSCTPGRNVKPKEERIKEWASVLKRVQRRAIH